jgi:hypothetical protein
MFRLAHYSDLAYLIHAMLAIKQQTGWRDEPGAYTAETLGVFLTKRLYDPCSVCYVWEADNGVPTAFCGCYLTRLFLPPYMPVLLEWGWTGPKRQAVSCWRACTQWGKKNGAVYAQRATTSIKLHPRRIDTTVVWEKL